ncbi:biotin/lipoyl-containing protein, partial [Cryocola sp. 340MFSha3.1]|uniref:biotin/lipoyl-containing protein n=1 Tax=Cryocola sp. 340MFSha3.1 TaxID=1169145 RepID=UPI00037D4D17
MTARVFTLPDLGEGLTDAELVRWLVAVGDTVVTDQPIAEVETAKSVVEVPSPYAGRIAALHGAEGENILVGAPLIEVEEETAEAPATSSGSGAVLVGYGTTAHAGRRPRASHATTLEPPRATAVTPPRPHVVPVVSPVVRALARSHGIDLSTLRPGRPDGVVTRHDVEAALSARAQVPAGASTA